MTKWIALALTGLSINQTLANNICPQVFGGNPLLKASSSSPKDASKALRDRLEKPDPRITQSRLTALETAFLMLEEQYGPLLYKQNFLKKFNWNQLKEEYRKKVHQLAPLDNYAFEQLLVSFFSKLDDAHVSFRLESDYVHELPLQVFFLTDPQSKNPMESSAGDKYLVNWVGKDYPQGTRKPVLGDELIGIHGKSVEDFRKSIPVFEAEGNSLTNRQIFGVRLSRLSEAGGVPLQRLPLTGLRMKFKTASGEIYETTIPFKTSGTPFQGPNMSLITPANTPADTNRKQMRLSERSQTSWNEIYDQLNDLMSGQRPLTERSEAREGEGLHVEIGSSQTLFKLPDDAERIVFPESQATRAYEVQHSKISDAFNRDFYQAATFVHEINGKKMRVGFLRIPSYSPPNPETAVQTLRYLIHELNNKSDLLVVDQMNNPGGYVHLSDAIARLLVGKLNNQEHMQYRVKPSQKWLRQYTGIQKRFAGIKEQLIQLLGPKNYNFLMTTMETNRKKIEAAFQEGKSLSDPIDMWPLNSTLQVMSDVSMQRENPNLFAALASLNIDTRILFTEHPYDTKKPIYWLTNALDFSGGDATAAILKDYQSRTVPVLQIGVGSPQTAGAGGTVEQFTLLARSISLTTSLMYRPVQARLGNKDQVYVENGGSKADKFVPVVQEDITSGFQPALQKIFEVIGEDLNTRVADHIEKAPKEAPVYQTIFEHSIQGVPLNWAPEKKR